MGKVKHPVTGEWVRDESFCDRNAPSYEHEFTRIKDTSAEIIERCQHCGYEFVANWLG